MKSNNTILRITLIYGLLSIILCPLQAQNENDSALNRSVTVERDFQPVIQAAGKIATKPAVVETKMEPAPIEYSDYQAEVQPTAEVHSMLSQPTRFQNGQPYHGYVRGGLGHANTLFDFGYHLDDGKQSILDVYAHHHAQWGLRALSRTKLGMTFTHPFSTCDLYFGVNGANIYYHKYGHFYDYYNGSNSYLNPSWGSRDVTSLWTIEAYVGVKANAKQDVLYRVQTGYKLFSKPGAVSEHQIRTHGDFDWHSDAHHVGAHLYVQNNILQLASLGDVIPDSLYSSRHNIRMEPYYEYRGRRIQLHVGVNIDMNIGQTPHHHLSGMENISFAPSPHIKLEAQVAKKWMTVYADVVGHMGVHSLQEYMEENRYSLIHSGITHPCAGYTPIDAELGLHIRPHRDLLIELHGGYAYMLDEDYLIATADSITPVEKLSIKRPVGDFVHQHTNYQRGKIGGQINYHYRDIVRVNLYGDAYFWSGDTTVYDRSGWELGLRVDGRIDQHWSLYSDNYFAGSRKALATDGEHSLAPTVQLNLGLQYEMWVGSAAKALSADKGTNVRPLPEPNLTLFFQLNNFIHRKNDIYYGYNSEGINFLLGATFRF